MAHLITLQELEKAIKNLSRIEEFVVVRHRWTAEPTGYEALRDLASASEQMVRTIEPLLDAHDIAVDSADEPSPEQLPATTFDSVRLAKMSEFMVRLGRWFQEHATGAFEPAADTALGQISGILSRIRMSVAAILESSPHPESAPDSPPPRELDESARSEPSPAAEPEPEVAAALGTPTVAAGPARFDRIPATGPRASTGARLVLEDTDQQPLLHTFKGETELTPEALELLDAFFTDHGVTLSGYQRHKLELEVERRVRSTPHGQVLVVKIGTLDGTPKPYFSYQPKPRETTE